MLAGLFRPRILLPQQPPQGEALWFALRHELLHQRRNQSGLKEVVSPGLSRGNLDCHLAPQLCAQRLVNPLQGSRTDLFGKIHLCLSIVFLLSPPAGSARTGVHSLLEKRPDRSAKQRGRAHPGQLGPGALPPCFGWKGEPAGSIQANSFDLAFILFLRHLTGKNRFCTIVLT